MSAATDAMIAPHTMALCCIASKRENRVGREPLFSLNAPARAVTAEYASSSLRKARQIVAGRLGRGVAKEKTKIPGRGLEYDPGHADKSCRRTDIEGRVVAVVDFEGQRAGRRIEPEGPQFSPRTAAQSLALPRLLIASAMPPRISGAATLRRGDSVSPSKKTPIAAASGGTAS